MYKAVYGLKELGSFGTFKEAFKAIHDAIKAEGSISLQVLETATWIENDQFLSIPMPTDFYDARDFACASGWLVGGKWVEDKKL